MSNMGRRAGNRSALSCVLPTRVPKHTLHLCTPHYVLLLHIQTQSLHYMHIHYGRTITRAVNGGIAPPRLGFLPGADPEASMSGEFALRETPLHVLRFLLWIITQPMIHIHSSTSMRQTMGPLVTEIPQTHNPPPNYKSNMGPLVTEIPQTHNPPPN